MSMPASAVTDSAVGSLVISADAFCQTQAPDYWDWSREVHQRMAATLLGFDIREVARLSRLLTAEPASPVLYRNLRARLNDAIARNESERCARLAELAWATECRSRLRLHVGDDIPAPAHGSPTATAILSGLPRRPGNIGGRRVGAAIVIPFRDATPGGARSRNLAATIAALLDQSAARHDYRIVVVEADDAPKQRDRLEPVVDSYVFARHSGRFNKAWAVNVGVAHGARPAETICVLDADMLVDRDFVSRALDRFSEPGTQAHLPFRDILFLDRESSARAIERRRFHADARVDERAARGVYLRRPPGCCVWVRDSLFSRVSGFDERFSGWGGEDLDFVRRVEHHGPLDRFADPTFHLDHPRATARNDDGTSFYASVEWCTWPLDSPFGDPGKFAA
ncbi:glycosyltransferase [Nonomuraea sp. NPDC050547]|uniref:glycosyltransferase n=1 Tax=unclassified Nonomuraea TaxID=2593643 RepID=UPI0037BCD68F